MIFRRSNNANHILQSALWQTCSAILLLLVLIQINKAVAFQEATSSAYECTQVTLEDIDPALLTKEERIALLDNSLNESINSFSSCVGAAQQTMAGGGYGEGDGSNNGAGSGGNGSSSTSTQGQSSGSTGNTDQGVSTTEAPETMVNNPPATSTTPTDRGIIPPKDNDKIICKLLFREIQSATDPAMLEGLKEQYSNYNCG